MIIEMNVEEMMDESSDPLAGIPSDGESIAEQLDKQGAPVESPTENAEEEQSPSQEGEEAEVTEEVSEETTEEPEAEETPDANENVPFHKNPRWQKMRAEKEALEAKVAELSSMSEKFAQLEEKVTGMDINTTVPPEYQKAFGDNVEAYNNYIEIQQVQRDAIKKEIREEMAAEKVAEQKAVEEQSNAIQANIDHVEETFNVQLPDNSSLRNEFVKFMWENQPTKDGNLNFEGGWKLFNQLKEAKGDDKSTSVARKKVVAKTAVDPKAETPQSEVYELGNFLPNNLKQH